jgi:predicted  nucleic acid-binding Zn-ribbon protein
MRLNSCFHTIAGFWVLALVSCGDDPKMVEKREQQKSEITRLKGEIALIEEKLKSLPPDVSSELAEAKLVSAKQSAEVAGLESEVADLESRKRALQGEFDAYRVKYQVK